MIPLSPHRHGRLFGFRFASDLKFANLLPYCNGKFSNGYLSIDVARCMENSISPANAQWSFPRATAGHYCPITFSKMHLSFFPDSSKGVPCQRRPSRIDFRNLAVMGTARSARTERVGYVIAGETESPPTSDLDSDFLYNRCPAADRSFHDDILGRRILCAHRSITLSDNHGSLGSFHNWPH